MSSSENMNDRHLHAMMMADEQIRARGITDERILEAFRTVPRHRFVPPEHRALAYADEPLPIGFSQTISQPYMVASMTVVLAPKPGETILEIGTGSGYQAAILARLGARVVTVERIAPLYERTSALLRHLDGNTGNVPVVLLYPGERRGLTGLSFMGMLNADNDYRPRIYP